MKVLKVIMITACFSIFGIAANAQQKTSVNTQKVNKQDANKMVKAPVSGTLQEYEMVQNTPPQSRETKATSTPVLTTKQQTEYKPSNASTERKATTPSKTKSTQLNNSKPQSTNRALKKD